MRRLLLLVLLAQSGCAYLRDRAADAADVLTLEVGLGYGLTADVKATDYLHVGVGYAHLWTRGFRGRDATRLWDREVGLPASAIFLVGALREGGWERLGHLHADVHDLLAWDDPWRRPDVEVGVTAGLVHLRLGLSPGHLLDLFLGLVGLDPAHDDRGLPFDDPAEPEAEWLPGDLHEHTDPPSNCVGEATLSPEDTVELAASNGCAWVGLTDHAWSWSTLPLLADYARRVGTLCARGGEPVVLPGFETAPQGQGHALVLFRDPAHAFAPRAGPPPEDPAADDLAPPQLLAGLAPGGALTVAAHPRTRDLRLPFLFDWATPWTGAAALPLAGGSSGGTIETTPDGALVVGLEVEGDDRPEARGRTARLARERALSIAPPGTPCVGVALRAGAEVARLDPRLFSAPDHVMVLDGAPPPATALDGLEALTLLHHLGELAVGRAGDELAFDDVFRVLDARIAAERRRYTVTGGSDNHRDLVLPTTWVLARARTREAIFDALRAGRVVIGGEEACSLEARTDLEPVWRPIGADLRAGAWVELRWRGTGTLVIDGARRPADTGPFRHGVGPGAFHAYRLEAGPGRRSRSAWIYVNRESS